MPIPPNVPGKAVLKPSRSPFVVIDINQLNDVRMLTQMPDGKAAHARQHIWKVWKINGTLGWESFILYLQWRLSPAIIAQTFSIRTSNSSAYLQRISSILRLRLHLTNNPEILFQEESTCPTEKRCFKRPTNPKLNSPNRPHLWISISVSKISGLAVKTCFTARSVPCISTHL